MARPSGDPQLSERDMGSSNSGDRITAYAVLMASNHIMNVRDPGVRVNGYVTA